MRSTMMDFPLSIGHIFEHGRALYADSVVVTSEAAGTGASRSGRWRTGPISWRPGCAAWASGPGTGSPPSAGITPSIFRPTSPSPAWAR